MIVTAREKRAKEEEKSISAPQPILGAREISTISNYLEEIKDLLQLGMVEIQKKAKQLQDAVAKLVVFLISHEYWKQFDQSFKTLVVYCQALQNTLSSDNVYQANCQINRTISFLGGYIESNGIYMRT